MNRTLRGLFWAAYPLYFIAAFAALMPLDLPEMLSKVYPFPPSTGYVLENNAFARFEAYEPPWTVRETEDWERFEMVALGSIPSLRGQNLRDWFHDPSFHGQSVVWNPDDRYEKNFIFSVRREKADLFVFGDSYMVSSTFKLFSYVLNEELGIPTFRRTFYGRPGPMETIHGFITETPEPVLRGKTLLIELSEGAAPIFISSQVIGSTPIDAFYYTAGHVADLAGRYLPLDRVLLRPLPGEIPPPPSPVAPAESCPTAGGKALRSDPAHLNPVLFEFAGRCHSLAFYHRNLSMLTWSGPFLRGWGPRISTANWLRKIGERAREKGLNVMILYVPTKFSTYWPIVAGIVDYDKAFTFVQPTRHFNNAIRSGETLRVALSRSPDEWRRFYRDLCRDEGFGFLDLTEPFRDATIRGEKVYTDFGTHWNFRGIRIAAEATARYLRKGRS